MEAAHKARAIISELLATLDLDRGGDIALQLQGLYTFFITHILDATAKRDGAELRKLLPILANLREAWQQIPDDIPRTGGSGNAADVRRGPPVARPPPAARRPTSDVRRPTSDVRRPTSDVRRPTSDVRKKSAYSMLSRVQICQPPCHGIRAGIRGCGTSDV